MLERSLENKKDKLDSEARVKAEKQKLAALAEGLEVKRR